KVEPAGLLERVLEQVEPGAVRRARSDDLFHRPRPRRLGLDGFPRLQHQDRKGRQIHASSTDIRDSPSYFLSTTLIRNSAELPPIVGWYMLKTPAGRAWKSPGVSARIT